jgi:hypothetical protein
MFRQILDNEIDDEDEEDLVKYKGHDHVLVARDLIEEMGYLQAVSDMNLEIQEAKRHRRESFAWRRKKNEPPRD